MMATTVREYVALNGVSPFREWFLGLSGAAKEAVVAAVDRMELGNLGDTKSVGGGVLERRIHRGPGYRVYFGRDGGQLILLLGGSTKRHQGRAIRHAQACWRDYQRRKQSGVR